MIFCTDTLGLVPAAVSTLMLVIRLFDAVNDPIIGAMIDKTQTRHGKFRPWLLWGAVGMSVFVLFLFSGKPAWSYATKLVFVYVIYAVVIVFATMQNMAYVALAGRISENSLERSKATSVRMGLSSAAMLLVGYLAPLSLNMLRNSGNFAGREYLVSILPYVLVGLPFMLLTTFRSREIPLRVEAAKKVSFKEQLSVTIKNRPVLILTVGMLTYGFVMYGRLGIGVYYFTYVVGDPTCFATYNLVNSLASIGGTFLAPLAYKRFGHKGRIEAYGLLLCAATMAAQYYFPAPHIVFYILTAVSGACFGMCAATQYGMIPDAIDYGEHKTGVRSDGFLASFTSFGFKVGNSLGTALIGAVLSSVGYIANTVQSPVVVKSISYLMTFVPTGFAIVAAIMFFFYNIDKKTHDSIINDLHTSN